MAKNEREAAEQAIADAVKAHKDDYGLVRVYPVDGPDAGRIDGHPAEPHDVEPDVAVELVTARPPAFTLYESGNPLKEHAALDELEAQQAWGGDQPATAELSARKVRTPAKPRSRRATRSKGTAKADKTPAPAPADVADHHSAPAEPAQNAEA